MSTTIEELSRVKERLAELPRQREQAREEAAARDHELATEEAELRREQSRLEAALSDARRTSEPSAEESRLTSRIVESIHAEQEILKQFRGILPDRYIRADALEHFQGKLKTARDTLEAGRSRLREHQSMSARSRGEWSQLEADERAFPRTKRMCLGGQKIHAIREQRRELTERRDALTAAREEEILAVV